MLIYKRKGLFFIRNLRYGAKRIFKQSSFNKEVSHIFAYALVIDIQYFFGHMLVKECNKRAGAECRDNGANSDIFY